MSGAAGCRRGATLLLVGCALLVAGCGTSIPQPDRRLPAGITVAVKQYRDDVAVRRVQVSVTNGSRSPVTVDGARLVWAGYSGAMSWAESGPVAGEPLGPGSTVDLPVPLPTAVCPAVAVPAPSVRVTLRLADGRAASGTVTADDELGALARVRSGECQVAAVRQFVGLEVLPPSRTAKGRPVSFAVRLTPTGRPGTVTVVSVGTTTLLSPVTGDSWPVNRTVPSGGGPVTLRLTVVPNRCVQHLVAEDKQGTLIPLTVRLDGGAPETVTVPASTATKAAIYAFVSDYCGW